MHCKLGDSNANRLRIKIANRSFKAIRANRADAMKTRAFQRINLANRLANRRDSHCELPGHISRTPRQHPTVQSFPSHTQQKTGSQAARQHQSEPSVCILAWRSLVGRRFVDYLGGVTQKLGASRREQFQELEHNETISVN